MSQVFQCRWPGSLETPFNQNYTEPCDPNARQTLYNGYVPEAQLQFVSDSVMAFAVALKVSPSKLQFCGKGFLCVAVTVVCVCRTCMRMHVEDWPTPVSVTTWTPMMVSCFARTS